VRAAKELETQGTDRLELLVELPLGFLGLESDEEVRKLGSMPHDGIGLTASQALADEEAILRMIEAFDSAARAQRSAGQGLHQPKV
jgi:hypothetical protein